MTWISLLLPLTFRQRGNTFCGSRLRRCPVAMAPQSPSFSRNVAPPQTIPLLGRQAERAFEAVRNLEPYRMWDMEVYSTLLWHLQRNVKLSFLAQELLSIDPRAPQAWIAVGNCFSLQKERVQALTCFHRSAQLDPTCAYAYTLSGHETIDDDSDKAITFFQAALRADPRHYNAWCVCESVALLSFCYVAAGPSRPVACRVVGTRSQLRSRTRECNIPKSDRVLISRTGLQLSLFFHPSARLPVHLSDGRAGFTSLDSIFILNAV